MSSREQVLAAVRGAIRDAAAPPIPRDYQRDLGMDSAGLIALFAERVGDYKADVEVIKRADVGRVIGNQLATRQIGSVVVPDDLDPGWLTTVTSKVIRDHADLSAVDLDQIDAVITGSAAAVALTGTIVLDGGRIQGRRAISLVPDTHVCVVDADDIVGTVPEVIGRLDPTRPLTWIAGPSATSDIELDRVEGVHGPRNLVVLITTS
ncbi:lactate utilization protein C [Microlunatus elymi]|uniref:Lactate utilization protein C n=1 Tax=Microlunatus elymi TaxID=2596828 RepID=A0A516Q492_9ACTN|nr:LUD domain-containing protein [Microlunatus elymi]QDP98031.1 lactate utilization protein C [Microlunatus elymi]